MAKYVYSMPGKKVELSYRRRLFNRFIVCFLVLLFVFSFIVGIGFIGMFSSSVYCAKHIPNSKVKEPELVMLMDNLEIIDPPKFDGIEYDYDGHETITNHILLGRKFSQAPKGYVYYGKDNVTYMFNYDFELVHAYKVSGDDFYHNVLYKVDTDKVIKEIQETVAPVLEYARKQEPLPGIQSLFNWYYYDRFN